LADWSKWHVSTAAEAITAAQFARFGYDVSASLFSAKVRSQTGSAFALSLAAQFFGAFGLSVLTALATGVADTAGKLQHAPVFRRGSRDVD
jgi:hypothetical protein